jgi:hypothetical protein
MKPRLPSRELLQISVNAVSISRAGGEMDVRKHSRQHARMRDKGPHEPQRRAAMDGVTSRIRFGLQTSYAPQGHTFLQCLLQAGVLFFSRSELAEQA